MSNFLDRFPNAESFIAFYEKRFPDISYPIQWTTGGMMGGSCWDEGDATYYPVEAQDEPENTMIDELLESAAPDLTFLEYKRLMKTGFEVRGKGSHNEYYGNFRDYATKTIDLTILYEGLRDIMDAR